jgi:hypothetical protein
MEIPWYPEDGKVIRFQTLNLPPEGGFALLGGRVAGIICKLAR